MYSAEESMKRNLIFHFVALLFMMFLGIDVASAQNEYEYEVVYKDSEEGVDSIKEIHKRITYGHWSNAQKAVDMARTLKKGRDESLMSDAELREILKKESGKTSNRGTFTFDGLATTGVVILDGDNHIFLIKHRDGNNRWEGATISESPDKEFRVECKSLGGNKYKYKITVDILTKKGVTKKGEAHHDGDSGYNFDYEDGFERFKISLNQLPADIRESQSRIILLPYAIDCQTEDTIAYLRPAVYEGGEYHELQDKRKDFDYAHKDSLGQSRVMSTKIFIRSDTTFRDTTYTVAIKDNRGRLIPDGVDAEGNPKYKQEVKHERKVTNISIVDKDTVMSILGYIKSIDRLRHKNGHIQVDTTIAFRKPDKKKTYRGMVRYTMEDYHHTYYDNIFPGTCLHVRPFKFLEANNTVAELDLDEEFYEKPEEGRVNIPPKDLGMFFEHGSTRLIEDSAYIVTINQIHADMRDITTMGGVLTKGSLTAYASPDGSEATNRRLAQGRAEVAKTKINNSQLRNVSVSAVIDTWDHTAEMLDKEGLTEEAEFVRKCIAESNGQREVAWRKIAAHSNYREVIKPVVDRQCRITFTYEYFANKVMNAQEALAAYRANKTAKYSNGDYYNIFTQIQDSLELDELTEIAYDRVINRDANYECQFAPYIINRMALLKLRQGIPDTTILKPLINEESRVFTFNDRLQGSDIKFNRPEIVLNQAVMFYMLNEPLRAKGLVNKLKRDHADLQGVKELTNFINFKDLVKIPAESRSNQQKQEFKEALEMMENAATDNRAVLYTEFENLNKRDTEAWDYVTLMNDNNPKKWYLMGLLWATRDGQEKFGYPLQEEEDDSISYGDETVPTDDYPYYMAYFWKSFDLDKSADKAMMKNYFNEGYINEEMRKKKNHAYKVSRIPTYKKIFRLRKKEDDKRKAFLMKFVKDGIINYDEMNEAPDDDQSPEDTKEGGNN